MELVLTSINETGGNGIVNIESRCKEMRGTCSWQTAQGEGTLLNCIFDLKAISQR
jgi:signal transduction histidine kinase